MSDSDGPNGFELIGLFAIMAFFCWVVWGLCSRTWEKSIADGEWLYIDKRLYQCQEAKP